MKIQNGLNCSVPISKVAAKVAILKIFKIHFALGMVVFLENVITLIF